MNRNRFRTALFAYENKIIRTGLAGTALQKFINYRITAAAIINRDQADKGRFRELLAELSQGNAFRMFALEADAEAWLLQV